MSLVSKKRKEMGPPGPILTRKIIQFKLHKDLSGPIKKKRELIGYIYYHSWLYRKCDFRTEILNSTSITPVIINIIVDFLFSLCFTCGADNLCFDVDAKVLSQFKDEKVDPYCISCPYCKETCKHSMHITHLDTCQNCYQSVCYKRLKKCSEDGCYKRICCGKSKCRECDIRCQKRRLTVRLT